jgi:hypothetical protein
MTFPAKLAVDELRRGSRLSLGRLRGSSFRQAAAGGRQSHKECGEIEEKLESRFQVSSP